MKYLLVLIIISRIIFSQEITPRHWNSLSTHVKVGVPLVDDASLIGGRLQVKASYDGGSSFSDLGEKFIIEKGDLDGIKQVSIPAEIFENMPEFEEGKKVQFIAQLWDRAGNTITGLVSDSILVIDQVLPNLVTLEVNSSNEFDSNLAMPGDTIVFKITTNEPIASPIFIINEESYDGSVGLDKSWMLVYPADEADDGELYFEINYFDLAGNPGATITEKDNEISIIKDGTVPELDSIGLFTSNPYDSLLAIKGDTVFLSFKSTEIIRDIEIYLNSNQALLKMDDSLIYLFYHEFTESDSEGIIPISIEYKDLAGNIGEVVDETTDDSEVTYDMTPPSEFRVEMVGSLQESEIKDSNLEGKDIQDKSKKKKKGLSLILITTLSILGFTIFVVWVSWYKIYVKLGESGWKALIPLFNIFIFTKLVDKPVWWFIIYLIFPVGHILYGLQIGKLFGKNLIFIIGLIILPLVFYPIIAFGKAEQVSK